MSERPASDWALEMAALGELPPGIDLGRHPETPARLEELARSDHEILAELAPAQVAAEVARRVRAVAPVLPRRRRRWLALGLATASLGALVLVLIIPRRVDLPGLEPVDETRVKGAPRLIVDRLRGELVERLGRQGTARPGDRLQLAYVGAGARYGTVLSIDGRGLVTLHFPAKEGETTRLSPGRTVPLSHSYELDDAPGFERFVFVTGSRPLDVGAILESARRLGRDPERAAREPLRLPPGLEQWSFVVRKEIP